MELFLIYLWLKLDALNLLLAIAAVFSVIVWIGAWMWCYDRASYSQVNIEKYPDHPLVKWFKKRGPITFTALVLTAYILPSQTQTAVLVAGHYALKVADTPEASKVMQVLRKKANEYLDAELKVK